MDGQKSEKRTNAINEASLLTTWLRQAGEVVLRRLAGGKPEGACGTNDLLSRYYSARALLQSASLTASSRRKPHIKRS